MAGDKWSAMYIDGELYEHDIFDEMHNWINGFLEALCYASNIANVDFDMEEFNATKPIDGSPDEFSELEDVCESIY